MQIGTYTGFGLTARPASENDGRKWCIDPNGASDFAALGGSAGYPVGSAGETCQQAVHDYYAGSWTLIP